MRNITCISLALYATSINAEDMPLGCFTRTYDTAHLAANPNQTVASLWIDFSLSDSPGYPRTAEVRAQMADAPSTRAAGSVGMFLGNGTGCRRYDDVQPWQAESAQAGLPVCSADCDGGYFEILSASDDQVVIRSPGLAIMGDDGCGPVASLRDDNDSDATIYKLFAAPPAMCDAQAISVVDCYIVDAAALEGGPVRLNDLAIRTTRPKHATQYEGQIQIVGRGSDAALGEALYACTGTSFVAGSFLADGLQCSGLRRDEAQECEGSDSIEVVFSTDGTLSLTFSGLALGQSDTDNCDDFGTYRTGGRPLTVTATALSPAQCAQLFSQ